MRTTIRLDDDHFEELRSKAHQERVSMSQLMNQLLRRGLNGPEQPRKKRQPFKQTTYAMGPELVNLEKAMSLAAELEDEEIIASLNKHSLG